MAGNTLEDLREHLFETLKALRDKEHPMDVDRARAISEVAKTVIDSAKTEVDYVRALGKDDITLPVFSTKENQSALPGVTNIRTHRIKG